jgi:Recombination protein MgsA
MRKDHLRGAFCQSDRGSFRLWKCRPLGFKRSEIRHSGAQKRLRAGQRTILFLDEIHRFNRAQQDALLPWVEKGIIILIGSTINNPSFGIIPSLLSRLRVFTLRALRDEEVLLILKRALSDRERGLGAFEIELEEGVLELIAFLSQGDARWALNTLEMGFILAEEKNGKRFISKELILRSTQKPLSYDREGEEHYNLISAYQKSIRGSDPDAAIYWLTRMLESGEDPLYIARRMIVCAAEDIGLSDPMALVVAVSAFHAFQFWANPKENWPWLKRPFTWPPLPSPIRPWWLWRKLGKR